MKIIERTEYLDWLKKHKDKQIIKVITGIRRCGKSTMFDIYRNYLVSEGVDENRIIIINFEDIDFENLLEYKALYNYIKDRLVPEEMNYIFLDEIQHVKDYQKAVDSLFLKNNCDVYITGSNAYFMSGELATLLTGRYIELNMQPFSFKEFCEGLDEERSNRLSLTEKFNLYIETGSFPYVLKYQYGRSEAQEYMKGIYNTILLNDVVRRLRVSDVNMLESVTRFLMDNIGNRTTPTTIANTMVSKQRKIDAKTVDRYLRGLTDSLMFYEARRYNIKGKEFLSTQSKYYVCDVAMRNMLVRGKSSDMGHILENIVYLELRRRGYSVYIGYVNTDEEVDFIAEKNGQIEYYQISQTTLEEKTLDRELRPLKKIQDNYPKYLLTLDEAFGEMDYEGIKKRNVLKWMLE